MAEGVPDDSLIRSGDGRVTPPAPVLSTAVATTPATVVAPSGGSIRIPRNITKNLADLKSEFDKQEKTLPPARPAKVGARPKGRPRKDPQPAPHSQKTESVPPLLPPRSASPVVEEAPLRTPELPDAPTTPLPTAETDEEEESSSNRAEESNDSESAVARPSPPGYAAEGEGLSFLTKLMLGLAAGSAAFLAWNAYVIHQDQPSPALAARLAKAPARPAATVKPKQPIIEPIDSRNGDASTATAPSL